MRPSLTVLLASVLCLSAAPALAETSEAPAAAAAQPQPFQLVRTLQSLQNQAAQGNRAAHAAQRNLLREIEAPLAGASPVTWNDPRNTRAAVLYVLSGGQPGILNELLKQGEPVGLPQGLAQGALAYVLGDSDKARALLMPLDPASLSDALGGQLALVQANLVARTDQKRALQLLDQARLLAPGTLVEEASLRRAIFIAGEISDLERLERATSQYLRRFENSVYAESFRQSFAAALVRFDVGRDPAKFPQLVATMRAFDGEQQRSVFLIVARNALIRGRFEQARRAAEEAVKLSGADQEAASRAALYLAASRVASDREETALGSLKAIDAAKLPAADKPILDTALRVATRITDWPAPTTQTPKEDAPPPSFDAGQKPLVTAAERGLGEAENLLKVQIKGEKAR
ncbi:chemotaxis protein [Bosea sp. BK604]|uniref:chemotaxis protein n=1 Tax=Bosea sp. BK604 TaxID=2512180 RepID=UPI001046D197|nr:chemotaxis protein [Bosea sp. BK604]TCR63644.1 chemotaxis protein MotC [Bosea sp. BK604]